LGGEVQGLLAGAALPVHGDAWDGFGEAGCEQGPSCGVAGLLADLADRATDHVVDHGRVDAGAVNQCPQRNSVQVDRVDLGVRTAGLAFGEGGADSVDDDSGGHECDPFR